MPRRYIELDDETNRMLNYYLEHSQEEENALINKIIKNFLTNHLSNKQLQHARQHRGKDSFPANDVLRNFGEMWNQD